MNGPFTFLHTILPYNSSPLAQYNPD